MPSCIVARELEVSPNQLHAWQREFEQRPNSAFSGEGRRRQGDGGVRTGTQDWAAGHGDRFFKGMIATDRRAAEVAGRDPHSALCRKIHEARQRKGRLNVRQMTALAGVSRATFYRFDAEVAPAVRDVDLRDAIQRIALHFPAYGRPRVTAELKRQGWQVNHKRVGRILREDNLLCLRKRKFQITTDSRHDFRVYPHLTRKFVPSARNQLWVADITYIRLAEEFVYLAVVLDAYSHLVIGWAVERTLVAKLAVGALQASITGSAYHLGSFPKASPKNRYRKGQLTVTKYPSDFTGARSSSGPKRYGAFHNG